jgi:hypothetical protein
MSDKIPIVVSLNYIKTLEDSLRNLAYKLQEANCYNTNLGLSDDLDYTITHMRFMAEGLSKITKDPSRFTLNRA